MSQAVLEQYTRLLIKAEAARAVCDYEDYRYYQAQAERLTK